MSLLVPAEQYQGEWVVSKLILDRADRFPEKVAFSTRDKTYTYEQIADRAGRFGSGLANLGVQPGDRVATMLESSIEYVTSWFGIMWAGAIDVPVNTDFKGEYLRHILAESGARAIIIDARWVERLQGIVLPDLVHVIVVGAADGDFRQFDQVIDSDYTSPVTRTEQDIAYVMYTSGTTGPSKGAILPHRTALWNAYAWIDILELTSQDVAYSMFPLFHVTARSAVITSTIWAGGSIALRSGFSLSGFWEDIRNSNSTFFAYMGSVVHLLHSEPERSDDIINNLRVAFGAAAPPSIIADFERRFGLELLEVYGSTELGPASAPSPGKVKRGTMGKICPHLEIQIQDPETNRALQAGEAGEICARPAVPFGLFTGYWNRFDETVTAFQDLWFHTGDRGFLDDEGYLVFVDRLKDCIRRRGENISSFEVERAVNAHPGVRESAAYAVPSDIAEEEVMCALVLEPEFVLDPSELRSFCETTMPRFAVPAFIRVVEALPKTPSQRIQKFILRSEGITTDAVDLRRPRQPKERSDQNVSRQ